MIRTDFFVQKLKEAGFEVFSGVPCSYLTPFINTVIDSPEIQYIGAANEGDAVAIACGAELGGKRSVVMFQNSGLGNAVNPLTSLAATLHIPVLAIVTWRGQPGEILDEPQHGLMGEITPRLMDLLEIPWEEIPGREEELAPMLGRALKHMNSRRSPYGLLMKKGTLSPYQLKASPNPGGCFQLNSLLPMQLIPERYEQDEVLRLIQSCTRATDVVMATTGYTGRALYALGDRPNQLYAVGSMGCVSSLGLGLANAQPQRRILVIDGDGAALMRMGAMATIGYQRPPNLIHILLDNGVHDSTGGQATVAPSIDLASIAKACGYPKVIRAACLKEAEDALNADENSLTFIHVRTNPRHNRKLPRPQVTPAEVAERLRSWLKTR